jgi:protein tyrosine phosphatase (PTP) superfamily phosphohydrolase (DUF442 family)
VSVGEQPRQSDLEELKKDGVATVVNLRVTGEDTSLTPAEERTLAEKLGLQYHHLPISLDKLDAAQVKELREILHGSQGFRSLWNGPTRMLVFACRFRHRLRFDFRTSR